MLKFSRKKGAALPEYALIAVLFAVTLGIAVFQLSPGVLKTFFIKSVSEKATTSNGNFEMKTLGE